jgi:hypothetical protein
LLTSIILLCFSYCNEIRMNLHYQNLLTFSYGRCHERRLTLRIDENHLETEVCHIFCELQCGYDRMAILVLRYTDRTHNIPSEMGAGEYKDQTSHSGG